MEISSQLKNRRQKMISNVIMFQGSSCSIECRLGRRLENHTDKAAISSFNILKAKQYEK